ncbi:MAG: hypothetical protein K0B11_11960 [Mariniphaga sp.]|nr:hypothetical protein [Mariniphaga sp.]
MAVFHFSFFQYYNSPLQGDLAGHVLPDKLIQPVFDDPFGFQLLKTGEPHSNPNRFFSHWAVAMYFQYFPLWLQNFTNPINSVYLASAIAKLVIQVLFIYILAFFMFPSVAIPASITTTGLQLEYEVRPLNASTMAPCVLLSEMLPSKMLEYFKKPSRLTTSARTIYGNIEYS